MSLLRGLDLLPELGSGSIAKWFSTRVTLGEVNENNGRNNSKVDSTCTNSPKAASNMEAHWSHSRNLGIGSRTAIMIWGLSLGVKL